MGVINAIARGVIVVAGCVLLVIGLALLADTKTRTAAIVPLGFSVICLFPAVSAAINRGRSKPPEVMTAPAITPPPSTATLVGGLDQEVLLRYRDGHGHLSDRKVTVHELHGARGPTGHIAWASLDGYCHARRGPRSFRLDRILSAADPTTGEIIADLPGYLQRRATLP